MNTWTNFRRSEGSSLVEFSLVALMLVLVLLSVAEMGRMVLVYTALNDAARAGVRYAIVHGSDTGALTSCAPSSCSGISSVVQNYASAGLLTSANVTTAVSYPDKDSKNNTLNTPGSRVTVRVSYTYDPLISYFSSKLNVGMGATSEGVIVF